VFLHEFLFSDSDDKDLAQALLVSIVFPYMQGLD
jgi:hypothetical protein